MENCNYVTPRVFKWMIQCIVGFFCEDKRHRQNKKLEKTVPLATHPIYRIVFLFILGITDFQNTVLERKNYQKMILPTSVISSQVRLLSLMS